MEPIQSSEYPVYRTKDYPIIKPNPENRPVDPEKVARLVREIFSGNNRLPFNPIIVNSDMVITSGHHRYFAAIHCQVDIYYMIDPDGSLQKAINEDSLTDHWTTKQHLERFAAVGKFDYVMLQNFWKEFPWLTISNLIRLCATSGYKKDQFPKGIYKIDRLNFARKVCLMAMDFKPFFKEWDSKVFLDTIMNLAVNKSYFHNRMLRKMKYQSSKMSRQATVQQYLDLMSNIYNYREGEDSHVYFHQTKRVYADDAK